MFVEVTPDIKAHFQGEIFISTRPEGKSLEMKIRCEAVGAQILELPMIEISSLKLQKSGIDALKKVNENDWIIFTSANGVKHFFDHLNALKITLKTAKIAVIGENTHRAVQQQNKTAHFVGLNTDGTQFANDLKKVFNNQFPKVLWATGNLSPDANLKNFEKISDISRINVYQTTPVKSINKTILNKVLTDDYSMLFFYSPSALHNFHEHAKQELDIKKLKIGCIGPTTEKACKAMGILPLVTAKNASDEGIFTAVYEYLLERKNTK